MTSAATLSRAYVNNGGDIALHLTAGRAFPHRHDRPPGPSRAPSAARKSTATSPVRGVATSGWRGRSFSLGIADAVTVLATSASQADAAATVIANAVDLPGHPAIRRAPASDFDPQSDLGERLVTREVGPLTRWTKSTRLWRSAARGRAAAAQQAASSQRRCICKAKRAYPFSPRGGEKVARRAG